MTPDPTLNGGASPAGKPQPSEAARAAAAALAGQPQDVTGSQGGEAANGQSDTALGLDQEILVDWEGTPRKVKVGDLVSAAKQKGEIEQMRAAVQRQLSEAGQLQAFRDAVEAMSEEGKAVVAAMLNNDVDGARKALGFRATPNQDGDDDDPLDDLASDHRARPRGSDGKFASRLDTMEQALVMLVGERQQEITAKQRESLAQQVEEKLRSYSIFADPKSGQVRDEARMRLAKEHVMLSLGAADQNVDLDQLVARVANQTQKILSNGGVKLTSRADGTVSRASLGIEPLPQPDDLNRQVAEASFSKPGSTKRAAVDLYRVLQAAARQQS